MKTLRFIIKSVFYLFVVALFLFELWGFMITACVQNDANECGNDMMTQGVRAVVGYGLSIYNKL
jgi:hypothetical protein